MADKLKMYVLAVGQGSCGLVAHYDSSNTLVQLDLCDCGRSGGMDANSLKEQMQLIRGLMFQRASALINVEDVDLYLDHIIISHKDADHLNLFTERYFLENCAPSSQADKLLEGNLKRRSRSIPQSELLAADEGEEEDEDENKVLLLEAEYKELENPGIVTFSVEYEWENRKENQIWHSFLTYFQKYLIAEGNIPAVKEPFEYFINLSINGEQCINDLQCTDCSILLDASPETGSIFWRVSAQIEILSTDEHFIFSVTLKQQDASSAPNAYLCLDMEQYRVSDYPLSPPGGSIAFCWNMELLAALGQFTQGHLQWLCTGGLSIIFPDIVLDDLARICACIEMTMVLFNQAFEQMRYELSPMFKLFSGINYDMIYRHLFGGVNAPNNSHSLAVGKIFVGGLDLSQSTSTAKNAVKRLATFCPQDVQCISGIVAEAGDILLLQMPIECGFWDIDYSNLDSAYKNGDEDAVGDFVSIPQEENSRSIMYMAPDRNGYRAVFPGDATGDTMSYFLCDFVSLLKESGVILSGTWLCAPHHGSWKTCQNSVLNSNISLLNDYLKSLSPNCILISSGFLNKFSHPRVEFVARAIASLNDKQPVNRHVMMLYDPEEGAWVLRRTNSAIYSTVSEDMDNGVPYYVNLAMETGAQEVTAEASFLCPAPSQNTRILHENDSNAAFLAARPPQEDAFPFLFDEPFITGTSAL